MDSLSILMPESSASQHPKHYSRPQTVQYIEALTARLLKRVSNHDWNHPDFQTFISDDYMAYLEYTEHPVSKSREEYLANYKAFGDANPNYAIVPVSISADVNEKKGTAAVWMHLRVGGHPTNVWRESVTILYWRRKGGKWVSYKQNGIRGVGWYLEAGAGNTP